MRGTPLRKSLKRVVPHKSSRKISVVHLEHNISEAIDTGQNWPYPPCVSMRPPQDFVLLEDTPKDHAWKRTSSFRELDQTGQWEDFAFTTKQEGGEHYEHHGTFIIG
ncbi:hypothetical protein [Phyllobacterium sp. K27]